MSVSDVILLSAYASLVIEIVVFPVASEASVLHLLGRGPCGSSSEIIAARAAPMASRIALYLLPTVCCVALFLLPIVVVCMPAIQSQLAPWSAPQALWAGLVLVLAGRGLTFGSVLQLRSAQRRGELPGGSFRHSRNPGLVGMFSMYIGLCLAVGGPWLWLGAPLYFVNMHARVKLEEADLRVRFASTWSDYACSVPRYLPFPGLR